VLFRSEEWNIAKSNEILIGEIIREYKRIYGESKGTLLPQINVKNKDDAVRRKSRFELIDVAGL
jgi:hypothetical protein